MQKVSPSKPQQNMFILQKRKKFLPKIFKHVINFTPSEIAEAVLLISMSNDQVNLFDQLASVKRSPEEKVNPSVFKFGNNVKLIDPSDSFLQPQMQYKFVTMHYLMNTIKRVKFIFVFTHSQTGKRPMRQIRDTLQTILKMFDESIDVDALSRSCGIIITDDDMQFQIKDYKQRIINLGLDQESFIQDVRAKILGKAIFAQNHVLLCNQERNSFNKKGGEVSLKKDENKGLKYSFLSLINELDYFQIGNTFSPSLPSNYNDYIECNIHLIWKDMYDLLYKNMDVLITGHLTSIEKQQQKMTKEEMLRKNGQAQLIQQLNLIGFYSIFLPATTPKSPLIFKPQHATLRLLFFINNFFQILEYMLLKNRQSTILKIQVMKDIVAKLFDALEGGQYICNPAIRTFFMSYFEIHDFLDNGTSDTVIQYYDFTDNIRNLECFNELMGTFILRFIQLLENDIQENDRNGKYVYSQIFQGITKLLEHFSGNQFTFVTDRIIKKIAKCQANLAYKQVKESMQTSNTKITVSLFLKFLRYACDCPFINNQCIDEAYIYLGDELTKAKEWRLALEMYSMALESKAYLSIIKLYENSLGIVPDVLKYIPRQQWTKIIEYFRQYCQFLTKIGLNQKTRELCLQGLRIAKDEDIVEAIKTEFINARGETSRDAHLKFLEDSILQERRPQHQPALLDKIQDTFLRLNRLGNDS